MRWIRYIPLVLVVSVAFFSFFGRALVSYDNATLYLEPELCPLLEGVEILGDGFCALKGTVRRPIFGADYEITLEDGTVFWLQVEGVRMLSYPIEADDNE